MNPSGPSRFPGGFVADARGHFPRPHPSQDSAIYLGLLAVFGCGPLAGIPAILLSRSVLREIADAPNLYAGRGAARAGWLLGWVGTLAYSALFIGALSSAESDIGGALVGVGLIAALLAVVAAVFKQVRAAWFPLAPVALLAAVLVGGGGLGLAHGVTEKDRQRREAAQACNDELAAGRREVAANTFDAARRHLSRAREKCKTSAQARLQEVTVSIETREVLYRQEEAKRQKLEAEAREAQATLRFGRETPRIKRLLGDAKSFANAGRWDDAWASLSEAQTTIASFSENRVGATPEWQALARQLEADRPRIVKAREALQQHRERLEEAKRQREEAKRQREEAKRQREEAKREREEARTRAAAARPASRGGGNVMCCDGTRSPTCGCNRASFRGCCSHHGGICGGCD